MIKYSGTQDNLFSSKVELDKRMMEYQHISLLSDVINILSTLILFSIGANTHLQIYQEDFKRKYKIYIIYISMKFYTSKSMVTELKK